VTTAARLASIAQNGLLPNSTPAIGNGPDLAQHKKGRLFLCEEEGVDTWLSLSECHVMNSFDYYEYRPRQEVPVVLRVRVDRNLLSVDEIGTKDAETWAYVSTSCIAPEFIEVWNGDRWEPVTTARINFGDAFDPDGRLNTYTRLRSPDYSR
jgi:hypothetical protein